MFKYRLISKLGEEDDCEYMKAQLIKTGRIVAIKCMKKAFNDLDEVNSLREVQALRRLNGHPYIIRLNDILFESGRLALVLEMRGQSLYEAIKGREDYLPEAAVQKWSYGIFMAIDHIHRNGIFHRNINPENFLLPVEDDGTGTVKLTGFGYCRGIYSRQPFTEYISTRGYRSPECLLTEGYYNLKTDIFSAGCVMFELVALCPLFTGETELDQLNSIHKILGTPDPELQKKQAEKRFGADAPFTFPEQKGAGFRHLIPHANDECLDLLEKCLTYDPDNRISARQVLIHPYLKEIRTRKKEELEIIKSEQAEKLEKEKIQNAEERAKTREFEALSNQDRFKKFCDAIAESGKLNRLEVGERFRTLDAWDKNKDGLIDIDEFAGVLAELTTYFTFERAKLLFEAADANKDGKIDVDEFLRYVFSKEQGTDYISQSDEDENFAPLDEVTVVAACDEQGEQPILQDVCIQFNGDEYPVWPSLMEVPIAVIKADMISTFDLPDESVLSFKKEGENVELSDERTLAEEGVQPGAIILAHMILSEVRLLFEKMEGIPTLADKIKMERIRTTFEEFDTNGDDVISEDELAAALVDCGLSDKTARSCFAVADVNSQGVVKYGEFIDWIFDSPVKTKATMAASGEIKIVYHCATKTACEGILNEGFCFPTEDEAHAKGLKLGAALCFGSDQEFCMRQALNTLAGEDPEDRKRVAATLCFIKANVQLGLSLSLGNYGVDRFGLSEEEYKVFTESLTKEHVNFFGYDTVTINEGLFTEEVAVYGSDRILELSLVDAPSLS